MVRERVKVYVRKWRPKDKHWQWLIEWHSKQVVIKSWTLGFGRRKACIEDAKAACDRLGFDMDLQE